MKKEGGEKEEVTTLLLGGRKKEGTSRGMNNNLCEMVGFKCNVFQGHGEVTEEEASQE